MQKETWEGYYGHNEEIWAIVEYDEMDQAVQQDNGEWFVDTVQGPRTELGAIAGERCNQLALASGFTRKFKFHVMGPAHT